MKKQEIIDCTIRDGGYYTNWNFSEDFFHTYLKAVSKLPISIIEIGYLSSKNDNNGAFFHLNNKIISKAKKIITKKQKVFAMINFKEIKSQRYS